MIKVTLPNHPEIPEKLRGKYYYIESKLTESGSVTQLTIPGEYDHEIRSMIIRRSKQVLEQATQAWYGQEEFEARIIRKHELFHESE